MITSRHEFEIKHNGTQASTLAAIEDKIESLLMCVGQSEKLSEQENPSKNDFIQMKNKANTIALAIKADLSTFVLTSFNLIVTLE